MWRWVLVSALLGTSQALKPTTVMRQRGQLRMSSSRQEEPGVAVVFGAAALAGVLSFGAVQPVGAVSGGGLDYASSDIKAKDFSGGDYSKKDFSGCIASLVRRGGFHTHILSSSCSAWDLNVLCAR